VARKYELKRRAERQEATRQRIVEAAVELHQTVGGAQATISAIAARAGVERLTVYRHFPDERALVTACTGHYLAQHPLPDPTPWQQVDEPEDRFRTGLAEVYAYHRRTEQMFTHAAHDMEDVPVLRELLAPMFAHWRRMRDILARGWGDDPQPHAQVLAAIGHALDFRTWRSLVREQGLDDAQAVELMVGMVQCAARSRAAP
jgi:AcrR family transcriptional regulator